MAFMSRRCMNRRRSSAASSSAVGKIAFVALAGVSHYRALEPIFAQLKRNGVVNIVEAYDMDKYTNPHVEKSCMQMMEMANAYEFSVHRLCWDKKYKGIDDWLASRKKRN